MGEAIISRRGGGSSGGAVIKINNTRAGTARKLDFSTVAEYASGATIDGNGNLWVGGFRIGYPSNSDVIDIFTPDGTRTTRNLSIARHELAAATDGDGNVWFGGGYIYQTSFGDSDVVDVFAPDGTRTTRNLSVAVSSPSAATDGNGNVWFGGGLANDHESTNTAIDIFAPDGTRTTRNLSVARTGVAAVTDSNGNVWFGGGYNIANDYISDVIDIFTPDGTRTTRNLSVARSHLAAATDGDGNVWFGLGFDFGYYDVPVIDIFAPDGTRTTRNDIVSYSMHTFTTDMDGNLCSFKSVDTLSRVSPSGDTRIDMIDDVTNILKSMDPDEASFILFSKTDASHILTDATGKIYEVIYCYLDGISTSFVLALPAMTFISIPVGATLKFPNGDTQTASMPSTMRLTQLGEHILTIPSGSY